LFVVLGATMIGCGSSTPPVAETPPPPVTVAQPIVKDVRIYDEYDGHIQAAEKAEIRARVKGQLEKVAFEAGQVVKAHALLYEIDPRTYAAALNAAEALEKAAKAAVALSTAELKRMETAAEKGAVSPNELDLAKAKKQVSEAELGKAQAAITEAKLNLDFTKIKAPFAGRISRTQVDVGNLINAGGGETLLTTVVTVDPIFVYFDVDERSFIRYRDMRDQMNKDGAPQPATLKEAGIPVFVAREGEQGFPHKGVLDFADVKFNPSTGTVQVRGVLPNANGIFDDGMRARVRVSVTGPTKAILVTERAVGTDQDRRFVYVVNAENTVERRDVRLGRVSDGLQVIEEGLKPDEWVIVNGIQRVRDGMKVEPKRGKMPGAETASDQKAKSGDKNQES
jgi:multidrug efflux system membrane fusion protein